MKKFLALFFLAIMACSYAHAVRIMLSLIGPTNSSSNVTIAAGSAGQKNCITDVDVTVDAQSVFRVLDGGTTVYQVALSSGGALVRSWNENLPLCGTAATAMYLNLSNGNFNIAYSGFVGQ